MAIARKCRWD